MENSIKDLLKKFIIRNYLLNKKNFKLADDDSFLMKGIIDSIGVVELASFIQREFEIKVNPQDILPENFDTLNNLEQYIKRKLARK